ncbi:MAG: hypothetical protein K6A63_01420 [Acholeplasmatales bacterium]|nr:hypothetical protein [Acholeplasmatales bacterium]
MKINLLNKNNPYDIKEPEFYENELISDLELKELINKAAKDDPFLERIFPKILLDMQTDLDIIKYRQEIYLDCKANRTPIKNLYLHAREVELGLKQKFPYGIMEKTPYSAVMTSVSIVEYLMPQLANLFDLCKMLGDIKSEGLIAFRDSALESFKRENLRQMAGVANALNERNGIQATAKLSDTMQITDYTFTEPSGTDNKKRWKKAQRIYFSVVSESLLNELNHLNDTVTAHISKSFAGATHHIMQYYRDLRTELGFYVAAMNLEEALNNIGEPTSMPILDGKWSYKNLYDAALALKKGSPAIGNDHERDFKICVITGANQGGKTTYIRSLGQAYLLMQAGLFVNAEKLSLPIIDDLFSHFDKEEDKKLESGKFDDELRRFKMMLPELRKNALILLNESFQSTSEHEGSKIGFEIISALIDSGIRVILVTHMYDLSMLIKDKYKDDVYFLRAERAESGERSYHLTEAEALRTSFGLDLYHAIWKD